MTQDALSVVSLLFSSGWTFFASFLIPGTHTTLAEFFMFSLLVAFVIKVIRIFFVSKGGGDD